MAGFRYADEIIDGYPAIRGGVIHASGLDNTGADTRLAESFRLEQERVVEDLAGQPLAEIPSLAAWRRAFSSFGVKPTQYRSAAEALLRRLTKQGDLPSINGLVDLANLVSIRYRLPVAVFDRREIDGGLTVRPAAGDERFTDLGSSQAGHPEPGEVVFVDEAGTVSARRWCWRQSAESAASAATEEALITVEALHDNADADVAAAVGDLNALLAAHQPGAVRTWAVLSPSKPGFES